MSRSFFRISRLGRNLIRPALAGVGLFALGCASVDPQQVDTRTDYVFGTADPEASPTESPPTVIDETSVVSDYVDLAMVRHPSLRAAFDRWLASLERIPQAGSLPEPQIMWTHFIEEVQTRTGPQENRFALSQAIPWFGKLLERNRVAAKEAETLWWKVETRRTEIIRDVKLAYLEYAYLARSIQITRENLDLLKQIEPSIQQKIATGGSQRDLLRLQVEVGKLENQLETLENYRSALSARLSAAVNLPPGELLPWPSLEDSESTSPSTDALATRLLESNPELKTLRWQIDTAKNRERLARTDRFPDFNLGFLYIDTDDAATPMAPMMPPPGSGEDPYAVTLGMTLPIWRYKYSAAFREARKTRTSWESELESREFDLRSRLELLLYQLDDASRQIPLYRDSLVPRAREALDITRVDYESGGGGLLDVVDSQRELLAMDLAFWRAVANREQRLADLEQLIGEAL